MMSDDCIFFVTSTSFVIDDILDGRIARHWSAACFGDSRCFGRLFLIFFCAY